MLLSVIMCRYVTDENICTNSESSTVIKEHTAVATKAIPVASTQSLGKVARDKSFSGYSEIFFRRQQITAATILI